MDGAVAADTQSTDDAHSGGPSTGAPARDAASRVAAQRAALRASQVAELEKLSKSTADGAAEPAKPAAKTETTETPSLTATDDDADVKASPVDADDKPADEVEADDPTTKKGLELLKKQEKRHREQIAKDRAAVKEMEARSRADFDADVQAKLAIWTPKIEAAQKYEAAQARVKTDPVGLLRSLGLSEDDFEYAAQQLFNSSKSAAADPKRKAYADQSRKEREVSDQLAQLQRKLDAMETEKRDSETKAQNTARETKYLDSVVKAVGVAAADESGDGKPAKVVAKTLAKSPDKAREAMKAIAYRLLKESGTTPDADEVIAAYGKQRMDELADNDIDVDAYLGKAAAPAQTLAPVAKPSRTLTTDASPTRPANTNKQTKEEKRAELLRGLEKIAPSPVY